MNTNLEEFTWLAVLQTRDDLPRSGVSKALFTSRPAAREWLEAQLVEQKGEWEDYISDFRSDAEEMGNLEGIEEVEAAVVDVAFAETALSAGFLRNTDVVYHGENVDISMARIEFGVTPRRTNA